MRCFVVNLWPPVQDWFYDITDYIGAQHTIHEIKDTWFDEWGFQSFIKGIYASDDTKEWKVDKKISYMKWYKKVVRTLFIGIKDPKFGKKGRTGKPLSFAVVALKKQIRKQYSSKIKNYFHDIIIHVVDNYEQSTEVQAIMKKDINIRKFLDSIQTFQYVLTKIDVPYMVAGFPDDYALGKDLDVLCAEEDHAALCEKLTVFAEPYKKKYQVRFIRKPGQLRVRFELANRFLCYQIDVRIAEVKQRIAQQNYFVFPIELEKEVRAVEYKKNPKKTWHLEWLNEH